MLCISQLNWEEEGKDEQRGSGGETGRRDRRGREGLQQGLRRKGDERRKRKNQVTPSIFMRKCPLLFSQAKY